MIAQEMTRERDPLKVVETGIPAFRIDESELLYMRLGTWAVSFEGYTYDWDNEKTLGPARKKRQFSGANLGITEQCDFNCNDWWSPRYDFDGYGLYFALVLGLAEFRFDGLFYRRRVHVFGRRGHGLSGCAEAFDKEETACGSMGRVQ